MADVLENILDLRRKSVQAAKDQVSLSDVEAVAKQQTGRAFFNAVTQPEGIAVISEMKRQSPSAGKIRDPFDAAEIAQAYEKGGAAALSVLTEPDFFAGSIRDLRTAADACHLPVLRKDFVFDPYQIAEARAFGGDAVLLIADMLPTTLLHELVAYATQLRIEPLVEVFTPDVLPAALNSGAQLIGINTRNLRTLEMVPENIISLSRLIPRERFIVAESGIKTAQDVEKLKAMRIAAVLVGESLLKQNDLVSAVKNLVIAGRRGL